MRRYAERSIEELRAAVDIVELATAYGVQGMKKDGAQYKALCPFHEERTGSLSLSPQKNTYHCFGCGAGGDAFDFVKETEGVDFKEAAEILAGRFGVRLDEEEEGAVTPVRRLQSAPAPTAPPIPEKTLERLAELRGWTRAAVERLGLTVKGDRVVFPVRDATGAVLGYTHYQPNPDRRGPGQPKMRADAGVPRALFPPPETVTGEQLWIVEGEPDAVAAHSADVPAVGIPGTQGWNAEWAPRFTGRRVVICTDCDDEGRKLAQKVADDLTAYATDVRVVDLAPAVDNGYDLSDVAKEYAESYRDMRTLLFRLADEAEPVGGTGEHAQAQRIKPWQDIALQVIRGDGPEEGDAIPLPFAQLTDAMYGGARPGELIVVGGWTNHCKSIFVDQMLDTATEAGRSGHLYQTEMTLPDRVMRLLARRGVPYGKLRTGQLDEAEKAEAEAHVRAMRYGATLISGQDPKDVCADIARTGWGLCVVDHLHDFPYRGEEDLRAIVQMFAATARESTLHGPGTCIVLVSQLNEIQMKEKATAPRPKPGLHSLKGASAIKQAADNILFVWMKDDKAGVPTPNGEIWIAKGRNNATAQLHVSFDPRRMLLSHREPSTFDYIGDPEEAWAA